MTTLTGIARVHGLRGAIAYTGVAAPSSQLLQSAGFVKDCAIKDRLLNPSTAEPVGGGYAQENIAGDIDFIPVATAAGDIDDAKAGLALPALPFKVTLSGFDYAALNGDYMCEGPISMTFTAGDNCRIRMPLIKFTASGSDATTLTTVVS